MEGNSYNNVWGATATIMYGGATAIIMYGGQQL